jgi:PIN domain nuclease of toxin-antitoxin system
MAFDPQRISQRATEIINDESHSLFLSHVSSWEIALKYTSGKLILPTSAGDWVPSRRAFFGIQPTTISEEVIFQTCNLSALHRDPFDRLLASHALAGDYTLISPDAKLDLFGVKRIW